MCYGLPARARTGADGTGAKREKRVPGRAPWAKNSAGENFGGAADPGSAPPWRAVTAAGGRPRRGVCVPQGGPDTCPGEWKKQKQKTRPCNLFLTSHPGLTPGLPLAGRRGAGSCDHPGPALPSWSRCVGRKDVAVGTGDLQDKKERKKITSVLKCTHT